MTRRKREQEQFGLMMLWSMSERNRAIDEYKKAVRRYCMTCDNWNEVCQASAKAHRHGVTDDELIEIDIEVTDSIADH